MIKIEIILTLSLIYHYDRPLIWHSWSLLLIWQFVRLYFIIVWKTSYLAWTMFNDRLINVSPLDALDYASLTYLTKYLYFLKSDNSSTFREACVMKPIHSEKNKWQSLRLKYFSSKNLLRKNTEKFLTVRRITLWCVREIKHTTLIHRHTDLFCMRWRASHSTWYGDPLMISRNNLNTSLISCCGRWDNVLH